MRTDIVEANRGGVWPWLGQRLTAAVVIVTISVHLILTHYVNIGQLSFNNIAGRLASGAVLLNDVLLILAVFYHALNGVRMVILDYGLTSVSARRGLDAVLWIVGVAGIVYAIWALWVWVV